MGSPDDRSETRGYCRSTILAVLLRDSGCGSDRRRRRRANRQGTPAQLGPANADVARTRLILRVGEPSSDPSFAIKRLDALGRRLLSTIYLRAYRKKRPVDLAQVRLWEPLVALARLTAGVSEERERLIDLIESAGYGGR